MQYDVIVVGAGPAGSTAARECASLGLRVLMLDRDEFPRDKPCGGGLTRRAVGVLPFDIGPVVDRIVHGMHLSVRHKGGFTRRSRHDLVYLTQRRNLDAFLAAKAVESGVVFREKTTVRSVERHADRIEVRTADETFASRALVAADGANGQTARMCGIAIGLLTGIALEGNVTPKAKFPPMWEDTLGLDVGTVPGGYGWIFPKGDHLNLGIGGWKYVGPDLKWHLKSLVEYYGYSMEDVWGQRGYHLPIRQKYSPLADGNVALVGDAAGLVDPLTGEGIHSALWSGRSAAKHIAEYVNGDAPDLSGYEREVMSAIVPELRISRQFHDLFNLAPQIFIGIERRTGWLWGVTERIILGDETYETLMQRRENLRLLVDLASDFVRVTPMLQRAAGLRDPAPPQRFFTGKAHQ